MVDKILPWKPLTRMNKKKGNLTTASYSFTRIELLALQIRPLCFGCRGERPEHGILE